jgi:hypothetical protein
MQFTDWLSQYNNMHPTRKTSIPESDFGGFLHQSHENCGTVSSVV